MSQWSDDRFLDGLRQSGDPLADAAVARLRDEGGSRAVGQAFRVLQGNSTPLPPDAPPALKTFMSEAAGLPTDVSLERLQAGGQAFLRNALPSVVVLLASSLPRGYAAPCLTEILSISGDLARHPYERLMGVVQLLVDVSDGHAFADGGRAIVTAKKLRLLHAGIRVLTDQYRPQFRAAYGVPVNHEDMLATIMAFSYLLVDGIGRLGLTLPRSEAEDLYYVWHTFARLMGIHPPDRPEDASLVPANLSEAAEFYTAYVRRTNTSAARNPAGVALTTANLAMMQRLLPPVARAFGAGLAPRLFMTELLTCEELARVGFTPLPGHALLKSMVTMVLRIGQWAGERDALVDKLAHLIMQGMVAVDRRGEVEFSVPFSRLDLHGPAFE
ncbi:MAG TPA: oxygenase MpaB family protein [Luteitalea sp.]|nr:oxygenase MpaB family protein [Luteitalea sp.]